jgi:ERCC4-type nuclease
VPEPTTTVEPVGEPAAPVEPQPAPSEEPLVPVEMDVDKKTPISLITKIPGIGPSIVKKLEAAKISSLEELLSMDIDDLLAIEGIGQKTAENLVKHLKKLIDEGDVNGP